MDERLPSRRACLGTLLAAALPISSGQAAQPSNAPKSLEQLQATLPDSWAWKWVVEPVFGSKILLLEAGQQHAQTLLLVHGLGNDGLTDWLQVLPTLAQQYHVITLDLPGFGFSEKPTGKYSPSNYAQVLHDVLLRSRQDRGNDEPAIVVGHSLGGAVSLRLAAMYPQDLKQLVLVNAAGILHRTAFVKHLSQPDAALQGTSNVAKRAGARLRSWAERGVELVAGLPDPSKWLARSDMAWALTLRRYGNTNAALALVDEDFSAAVASLAASNLPTQLIWGSLDDVAPLRTGKTLAARLGNAQLHVIEGAGHTPMESAVPEFTALLMQVLIQEPVAQPELVASSSTRKLHCKNQVGQRFSGTYDEVLIETSEAIELTNLSARKMLIKNSTVDLFNVRIDGQACALEAVGSRIHMTVGRLSGGVALKTATSRFDLAGVSLQGRDGLAQADAGSSLIASLCDFQLGPAPATALHGEFEFPKGAVRVLG